VRNLYRPFDPNSHPATLSKAIFHAIDSWNPYMAAKLRAIAAEWKPDVANTHNLTGFSPAVIGALSDAAVPVAHTMHDMYLLCPKTTMFRHNANCPAPCPSCRVYAHIRGRAAAKARLLIGVSQFIVDRHKRFLAFQNTPMTVIRNANTRASSPTTANPARHATLRFGYLGQIRATKGVHVLIGAFAQGDQPLKAELHIAGHHDSEYAAQLRASSARHANIIWHGYVNAADFLSQIDVLVIPSLWNDTAPLVLLEALSAGRPVIGSRRGGVPEFITPHVGWTFEPDDPGSLREILRECVSSPDQVLAMSANARAHAAQYNIDGFLSQYVAAFESIGADSSALSVGNGNLSGNEHSIPRE
jgi:glycosyltransferase involved in cell wall biosynthesis